MSDIIVEPLRMSPSLKSLAASLAKAQAVMQPAAKDHENPFFKSRYADLPSVWDAIREPLTANGLSVVQLPAEAAPGRVALTTMLLHSSGEWIASTASMRLVKDDPQGAGSGLTYLRRYMLAAAVGVVADEDDDANAATAPQGKRVAQQNGRPDPVHRATVSATVERPDENGDAWEPPTPISPDMVKRIEGMMGQLKLDWNMPTTKKRAERVIGRPISEIEKLSHLNADEGGKLMKALFSLMNKTAVESLERMTEPATA